MKFDNLTATNYRKDRLILLFLWMLTNGFFLWKFGIVTTGEAAKYIYQAQVMLETGHPTTPNFWMYITEIALIMAAIRLKLGWILVVIVQLAVSLWALFAFYKLANKFFLPQTAFCIGVLFLLNYPMHQFNVYLQTESLFFSISILFAAYLLQIEKLTAKAITIVALLLALLTVTRPSGILFVPATFLYLFFSFLARINTGRKLLIVAGISVAFLFALNEALGSGGELDFMLPFLDERIICGVPTLDHIVNIDRAADGNSLYGLFYYITHNFGQFIRMAFFRSRAFFGLLRDYFSVGHNIFLALFFYPIYILAVAGIRWWMKKYPYHLLFFSMHMLATWGTVILTCDDWHNRFFLTISPWLILMVAPVINKLCVKFAYHDKQHH